MQSLVILSLHVSSGHIYRFLGSQLFQRSMEVCERNHDDDDLVKIVLPLALFNENFKK